MNISKFIKSAVLGFVSVICFSTSVFSQSYDLYIVINEADWCKYCKANGERIHTLIDEYAYGKEILVVSNDVTNEKSKLIALPQLQEMEVSGYFQKHKEAAVIFVFDAKSKKILDKFSLKTNNEDVIKYLDESMKLISS